MNDAEILDFGRYSIYVLLQLSLPLLIVGLVIGLIISLFQTLTQIQEATLTFVPKIIAVFMVLIVLLPWKLEILKTYMANIADRIINIQ